jgi:hypothetical protein
MLVVAVCFEGVVSMSMLSNLMLLSLLCMLQTLKEVMGIRPLYNVNPSHIGVLYQVDK